MDTAEQEKEQDSGGIQMCSVYPRQALVVYELFPMWHSVIHISPIAHCISRGRCECKEWLVLVAISKKYVFNYLAEGKIEKTVSLLWDWKSVEFIMDFILHSEIALRRLCCLLPSHALPLLWQWAVLCQERSYWLLLSLWHGAALCCCSEKCVHNFCQPFEEALIREEWGSALLGAGEAQPSWGTLSCSPRHPWYCSYTVTKSLPVPGNVQLCVWCVMCRQGLLSAL